MIALNAMRPLMVQVGILLRSNSIPDSEIPSAEILSTFRFPRAASFGRPWSVKLRECEGFKYSSPWNR